MPVVQSLITIVLFFVVLGLLVIVHELGHFFTARAANVRVLEFGIGFPPRAKVLRSKGETLYTLNWLPIGGFVKLEGEDGEGQGDPRSFSSQNLLTRLWILVAGVLMNIILAFVLFAAIAWFASPYAGVKIGSVVPDSPAAGGRAAGRRVDLRARWQALPVHARRVGHCRISRPDRARPSRSRSSAPTARSATSRSRSATPAAIAANQGRAGDQGVTRRVRALLVRASTRRTTRRPRCRPARGTWSARSV